MFIHADIFHLISNVLLQLVAGIIVERDQACWRTMFVYLGGGIAGSMASVDKTIILGGSSGAYALFFSQIPQVILVSWSTPVKLSTKRPNLLFHPLQNHQHLKYLKSRIAYLIACIIGGSFYEAFMIVKADPAIRGPYQVAFVSHIAGLLSGVTIGFVLFKQGNRIVRYSFSFVLFYLTIVGIIYNIYRTIPVDLS